MVSAKYAAMQAIASDTCIVYTARSIVFKSAPLNHIHTNCKLLGRHPIKGPQEIVNKISQTIIMCCDSADRVMHGLGGVLEETGHQQRSMERSDNVKMKGNELMSI